MASSPRERQRQLAELCVYGFMRMHYSNQYEFPHDLIKLCLAMYLLWIDEWNLKDSTDGLQLTSNELGRTDSSQEFHGDAVGKLIIRKGNVKTWKFQTLSPVIVGVINYKVYQDHKDRRHWFFTMRDDAFGLSTGNGNKMSKILLTVFGVKYAVSCHQNQVIEMTLDMTGDQYATLSFKIDAEDYGNAFDKIDIDKEYCMIVTLYNEEKIKLLQ